MNTYRVTVLSFSFFLGWSILLCSCEADESQNKITIMIGRSPAAAPAERASGNSPLLDAVEAIPQVTELSDAARESKDDPGARKWDHVAVFEGACRFVDYKRNPSRTLIIYEGMQIAFDEDGSYNLSLIAEAPRTTAVLHLQLALNELVDDELVTHGTITLPPIVIEPEGELTDQQPSHTVRIRHRGFSHALKRSLADGAGPDRLSFGRTGSTRFGSVKSTHR